MRKKLVKGRFKKSNFKDVKVAIVKSLYHNELNSSMASACIETLISSGVLKKNIDVFEAPGSWEIGVITEKIASSNRYDGIVTFGVVVKGDTYHFEMIANEVGRALMNISVTYTVPVIMEILAVFKLKDAKKRTSGKYNKGIEAANAVLKAVEVLRSI